MCIMQSVTHYMCSERLGYAVIWYTLYGCECVCVAGVFSQSNPHILRHQSLHNLIILGSTGVHISRLFNGLSVQRQQGQNTRKHILLCWLHFSLKGKFCFLHMKPYIQNIYDHIQRSTGLFTSKIVNYTISLSLGFASGVKWYIHFLFHKWAESRLPWRHLGTTIPLPHLEEL